MARSAFSAVAAVLSAPLAFAAGPFGSIHVGSWNGGAFTDDNSGGFSHCAAVAAYANGLTLILGQNIGGAWLVSFAHPSWQLTASETIPIDATFDAQAQFHFFGVAAAQGVVNAFLPGPVLEQFRKAHTLAAVVKINAMVFAKATGDLPENINFAIKTGAVRDFLDNSAVSYQTAEPGAELKAEQIASNARAYTMLISCTANEDDKAKK